MLFAFKSWFETKNKHFAPGPSGRRTCPKSEPGQSGLLILLTWCHGSLTDSVCGRACPSSSLVNGGSSFSSLLATLPRFEEALSDWALLGCARRRERLHYWGMGGDVHRNSNLEKRLNSQKCKINIKNFCWFLFFRFFLFLFGGGRLAGWRQSQICPNIQNEGLPLKVDNKA